jgi:DNA-directed RNA polymerase alpha subunit
LEKNSKIVSSNSEIWKIKELNNTVIKALLWSEITTIYELSITSEIKLAKIPMIGRKSIFTINEALKIYGFKMS